MKYKSSRINGNIRDVNENINKPHCKSSVENDVR